MSKCESKVPNVLILPDGSRRWAKRNGVNLAAAYELGAAKTVEAARYLGALGANDVWFGAARPFNFRRSPKEVKAMLNACLRVHEIGKQSGQPINITAAGSADFIPATYKNRFREQEQDITPEAITVHMLIGWSAEEDVRALTAHMQKHPVAPTDTESLRKLGPVKKPIDYLIRTGLPPSGGGRVSGMVPWHSLEAELYFTSTLFPDFTTEHLQVALDDYGIREHRNQLVV